MITVKGTPARMRGTIPTDEIPPERESSFVDWLRLESLARRSRLGEAQADALAEQAKAGWWEENKAWFIPPGTR